MARRKRGCCDHANPLPTRAHGLGWLSCRSTHRPVRTRHRGHAQRLGITHVRTARRGHGHATLGRRRRLLRLLRPISRTRTDSAATRRRCHRFSISRSARSYAASSDCRVQHATSTWRRVVNYLLGGSLAACRGVVPGGSQPSDLREQVLSSPAHHPDKPPATGVHVRCADVERQRACSTDLAACCAEGW